MFIDTTKTEARLIPIILKKYIYLRYSLMNDIKEYVAEFLQGFYDGMGQSNRIRGLL